MIGIAINALDSESTAEKDRKTVFMIIGALSMRAPYSELYSLLSSLPQKRAELTAFLELLLTAVSQLRRG